MELLQLKYFCDAARTQNFSRTAAKFYVPPSNISQVIKRLERELGAELFEHRANKVVLSEAGRRFYERASEALALIEEAGLEVRCDGKAVGEIKLLILANRRTVTEAIEKFKSEHPNVSFIIRHEYDAELDFDIIISDSCPDSYFEHGVLVDEEILLAMSREHPLAGKNEITAEELRGERFISMPRGRSIYEITSDICKSAGFSADITIQTDDPYYVRKYVELGLGIAFFPACSWKGLFSDKVVLKKVGEYTRRTSVFLPKKRTPRASHLIFTEYLLKNNTV